MNRTLALATLVTSSLLMSAPNHSGAATPGRDSVSTEARQASDNLVSDRFLSKANEADDVYLINSSTDQGGRAHFRYQHTVDGIRVIGSQATVHLNDDGSEFAFIDKFNRGAGSISTDPSLIPSDAVDIAFLEEGIGQDSQAAIPVSAELVIYPHRNVNYLAYKVDIDLSATSEEFPRAPRYFVDATSGDVISTLDSLNHGTGDGYYQTSLTFPTYLYSGRALTKWLDAGVRAVASK